MIEKFDVMPILVNACPSFGEVWQKHLRDFGDDLHYVAAGAYARHLLQLFRCNETAAFSEVGEALERLVVEGAPSAQELAVVGVLEGIQNVWGNDKADPEDFFPYFGRESREAWVKLNNFWAGKGK